jgi:hypothetical protein
MTSYKTQKLRLVNLAALYFILLSTSLCVLAQDVDRMYQNLDQDRRRFDDIQLENKMQMQRILDMALKKGKLWKCPKNTYLFYDGWVFVGNKEDGSDIGRVPYNIVGSYYTSREFVKFTFQGLAYENVFELNTRTSELFSYLYTLNKLERVSCKFIH